MAAYSVMDNTNNMILEMSLQAFTEFQPQLQIDIKPRPQQGGGMVQPVASAAVLVYQLPGLINNMTNPMDSAMLQINNRNSGTSNVGRMGNDFIITNNNGSFKVTLMDSQWSDTYNYVKLMYENASLIKEIGRNVRMHVINVLREIGLDMPVNGRFKATNFYDYRIDSNLRGNSNFSHSEGVSTMGAMNAGFSQNGRTPIQGNLNNSAGVSNPAPLMGMPTGTAMPPLPVNTQGIQQGGVNPVVPGNGTMPGSSIPNMGSPMPPLPVAPGNGGNANSSSGDTSSLSSGIQDMLSTAFQQ